MRKLMMLLLTLILIACGGGGSQSEAEEETSAPTSVPPSSMTTATPTTTEATTTTRTQRPATVPYGPTVLVEGREDCLLAGNVGAAVSSDDDGTVRFREGEFDCTVTNNDPRIAGTAHYTLDMDRWGTSPADAAQVMWGTIRIENDGGAWEADYVGVYTGKWGDVFTALFTGTGDYEGLSYYQWAVETRGESWPTKGLIFPGGGPTH